MIVTIDKSKESTVLAGEFRGLKINRDGNLHTWLNRSLYNLRNSLEIISIGLNEDGISWPFSFSCISESPSFGEELVGCNAVLISKTFFDESSLVKLLLFS